MVATGLISHFCCWRVSPVRTAVGTVSRQYGATAITGITLDATFANGVAGGWNVVDNVVPLGSTQGCAP